MLLRRRALPLFAVLFAVPILAGVALADPPSWAPAWGQRAKHDGRGSFDRGDRHRDNEGSWSGVVRIVIRLPSFSEDGAVVWSAPADAGIYSVSPTDSREFE